MVVDPFAVGNGHADAAVGGRSAEFVVFLSGNVVNACGLSRDAVEEDAGVAESCTILTVCGLDEGMPSVFACGFKGSRWSLGIFFSRGTDKGPVRNDISVSIVRGIYGYLAAGTVHNDLERLCGEDALKVLDQCAGILIEVKFVSVNILPSLDGMTRSVEIVPASVRASPGVRSELAALVAVDKPAFLFMKSGWKVLHRRFTFLYLSTYGPESVGIYLETVRCSCVRQHKTIFIEIIAFLQAVLIPVDPVPAVCGACIVIGIVFPLVRSALVGPCSGIGYSRIREHDRKSSAEACVKCIS